MQYKIEKEITDRLRRIETRLTRYLEQRGFDTQVQRPTWGDGVIYAPTSNVSVRECLELIPASWPLTTPVTVMVKDDVIAHLYPGDDHR